MSLEDPNVSISILRGSWDVRESNPLTTVYALWICLSRQTLCFKFDLKENG